MKASYLHSVRRLLDYPAAERERLLRQLDRAVSAWIEDNPCADKAELAKTFGTPEVCAARLMEECDSTVVTDERRRRKLRTRVLIAVLTMLLLIAAGIAVYLWNQSGLVIIEHVSYGESFPDDLPMDQIIYDYDD